MVICLHRGVCDVFTWYRPLAHNIHIFHLLNFLKQKAFEKALNWFLDMLIPKSLELFEVEF